MFDSSREYQLTTNRMSTLREDNELQIEVFGEILPKGDTDTEHLTKAIMVFGEAIRQILENTDHRTVKQILHDLEEEAHEDPREVIKKLISNN